ncbi:LytR C-terminal domain-containing protein [Streptomyces chartreusis]|uniref:LytR C-terminal domain-containing protein n=1 Tax=Streptomyces TaxID=1883 RepID=UPI002E8189EF|nr:LytR C-terminal domain-containing protein [Streptomyces chartreusis]WSZ72669.1 LytR C-terminal domain-containing protein [Streptomyces chartreusis]WTA32155.1 LytR C-terminal domain-containing protein [Streptomyces chartreusis]WUB23483.1 LytR C-terminal domain-containing protein [Streptomyces chartreusis]
MGGQYRIKGDKYPRLRRRRRRGRFVVLAVASVTALGVAGWGTLQLIDVFTGGGGEASAAGPKSDCGTRATPSPTATAPLPKPAGITVNVLNATTRSGLAKQTADELKKRGFKIGDVGNATKDYDKKVKGTGLLLGPAASLNTSLPVLATQLTTAERRTDATRKGATVDLIIGDRFKELTKKPDAEKALTALSNPKPTASASKKGC